MGKYMVYGYLLDKAWLVHEGIKQGLGTKEDGAKGENIFLNMLFTIMTQAGLDMGQSKLLHVRVMAKGKVKVWPCLALATNDPRDQIPKSKADQLNLERLRELLLTDKPPKWYPYNY